MALRTGTAVPTGSPIQVEFTETLYLGEVCYCRKDGENNYLIGLRLRHLVSDLPGLLRLADAVFRPFEAPLSAHRHPAHPCDDREHQH